MTKYIKAKNGTFAGSIGDGKTNAPVAPATPPLPLAATTPAGPSIEEQFAAYSQANEGGYCARCESDCDELSDEGYCGGCFDDIEEGRREPMTPEERAATGVVVYTSPLNSDGTIRSVDQFPATPYSDGSIRTVRLTAIPAEARTRCEFLVDGVATDYKYLTAAEEAGLGEFVHLSTDGYEVDAHQIANVLDHMSFDDEDLYGDATNFEITFARFTTEATS